MMPMSLVMEAGSGKSYLLNLLDCPGHVNFNDEASFAAPCAALCCRNCSSAMAHVPKGAARAA